MCSVVGCYSGCRGEQLFKLPEDPETRLEWVQFLATVNDQRFKESSCTDICVCIQHFKGDCFVKHLGSTGKVQIRLKPRAVPTVFIKLEPEEPGSHLESQKHEKPLENTNVAKHDQLKTKSDAPAHPEEPKQLTSDAQGSPAPRLISRSSETEVSHHIKLEPEETTEVCPHCDPANELLCAHCGSFFGKPADITTSCSEESKPASLAPKRNPVQIGVSPATDTSNSFLSIHDNLQSDNVNADLIREKAASLQRKGMYVVNEKQLMELFNPRCPSCGCKLQMEKVAHRVLIIVNQQCPQCDYRRQWKSQINANVPRDEDQQQTGGTEAPPKAQQLEHSSTTEVPQSVDVSISDGESDLTEESVESSIMGDDDSDEDWNPRKNLLRKKFQDNSEKGSDSEEEDYDDNGDGDDGGVYDLAFRQLCVDCGSFYNKLKHHTCEHKTKPFSCNICGKRCTNEIYLREHSKIHDENYEHPCKFCCVTFKTKLDKITHEQTHSTDGNPYKCPDCSEMFATYRQRRVHLRTHRGLCCNYCGMEFKENCGLQRHLAVHTGEKAFKCSVCQRGFSQASHLKSHMRLHTGERPFKCQHCDKCFNHNVSLKSHLQRYHTSNSEGEQKNSSQDKTSSHTGSTPDNGEEEPDTVQKEELNMPKTERRGRPKGTTNRQKTTNETHKLGQKVKRKKVSETDSEDEPSESDMFLNDTDDEEEEGKQSMKYTARSKRSKKLLQVRFGPR